MKRETLLDVWKVHTTAVVNETIPFCSQPSDCWNLIGELISNSSKPLEIILVGRMWCTHNVDVPPYFLNAVAPEQVIYAAGSEAHAIFVKSVCTCDVAAGFSGADCPRNTRGMVLASLSVTVFAWIVYLALWVLVTMARGELKTTSKKKLGLIALGQYVAQLVWISAMNVFPSGHEDYAGQIFLVGVGFGGAVLTRFWFMCSMTGSVCDYVREGTTDQVVNGRLRFLAKLFRVIPPITGIGSAALYFNNTHISIIGLALLLLTVSTLVAITYSYCINVLDQRVVRLLPPAMYTANKSRGSGHCGSN
jgi:hypothetical protein